MRRVDTSSEVRIFVVDDNANHSAGIKQLVELHPGFTVIGISTNGDDAIKRLNDIDVDIVLMDMNMPELDGVCYSTNQWTQAQPQDFGPHWL
jgi:DNA-binding NarL/FixJ family response regulator